MNRSQETIVQTGLTAAMVSAPVCFGAVHPWAAMPICGLLLCLFLFNPAALNNLRSLSYFFSCGIILLLFFIAAQAFLISPNRAAAARELVQWSAFGAGFLLIQNFSRGHIRYFFHLFVFLGLAECVYG